jgi:ATP-dependent RNA helicase DeaD
LSSFTDLGISDEILRAITELGFETPSDIQNKAIPFLLEGDSDFIGLAQTGTGKTAAFGLPLLHHIDTKAKHTQALILAPTRELCKQISEQIGLYSKYLKGVKSLPVYGGAAIVNQIKALKKPQHIIIATPGRLIDLLKRKAVDLSDIEYVILDEADEMLNMGFKEEIDQILEYSPEDKFTWLFSATMPKAIRKIVNKYMDQPMEVRTNLTNEVNQDISHQFIVTKSSQKREALCRILDTNPDIRGVVFCRTRLGTQGLAEELLGMGYKVDGIHGDLSQAQRERVMKRFKSHDLQLLCATDVAARGIDVNDLTHVFHYQLPDDVSYYTHRSGRTGRAGKKGISISLINSREKGKINRIAKQLKIEFTQVDIPTISDIAEIRIENWAKPILAKEYGTKLNYDLVERAFHLFDDLSKKDLITKLVAIELDKLNLTEITKDSSGDKRDKKDKRMDAPAYRRSKKKYGKKTGKKFFDKKKKKDKGKPNFKKKKKNKDKRKKKY